MYAVMRSYSGKGSKELFDVLEKSKSDLGKVMSGIKGFVGYTLARSGDGGFSLTSCLDKAGADESARVAKDWIAKNAANVSVSPPMVSEGTVILQMK
jgi:hypothetical protein